MARPADIMGVGKVHYISGLGRLKNSVSMLLENVVCARKIAFTCISETFRKMKGNSNKIVCSKRVLRITT